MATTFEKLSSNKVKLGFVVESDKFDEGIRKAYQRNVKKFNIPGFRRGKAPMKIIENYYGPGVFYEDAFDIIFPDIYRAALEEHDVKPVDRPELEVEQIEKGKELKFTVEVFVRPDVELGQYTHLGIEKKVEEVTDDDVMADIERARDRAARYVEVLSLIHISQSPEDIQACLHAGVLPDCYAGSNIRVEVQTLGQLSCFIRHEDGRVTCPIGRELFKKKETKYGTEYSSKGNRKT